MASSDLGARCDTNLGFSYTEVLVAVTLLALLLVPALEALQQGVSGSAVREQYLYQKTALVSRMEEVLAESFDDLEIAAQDAGASTIPTSYSDAALTPDRRLVYIAAYDGDNVDLDGDGFTGSDAGLLWIRVEIEETWHALETVTAK